MLFLSIPESKSTQAPQQAVWIRFFSCNLLRACSSAWLERIPDKDEAGGSSPPRPTIDGGLAQLGERLPCKQEVVSSILISSTI